MQLDREGVSVRDCQVDSEPGGGQVANFTIDDPNGGLDVLNIKIPVERLNDGQGSAQGTMTSPTTLGEADIELTNTVLDVLSQELDLSKV